MLRWLRKAFTQNLLLKFTALVCAVVLWLYVDSAISGVRQVYIPARAGMPEGWRAEVVSPEGIALEDGSARLRLTLRGPKRLLETVQPERMGEFGFAALGYSEGETVVFQTDMRRWPGLPPGVRVIKVEPEEIGVRFRRVEPAP